MLIFLQNVGKFDQVQGLIHLHHLEVLALPFISPLYHRSASIFVEVVAHSLFGDQSNTIKIFR
jgi:hypothetical protein